MRVDSAEWNHRELTLDGARVRYAEAGSGEPVLLLHGYPQSHLCWRHHIPPLAVTHRVVAPDWLGWGDSERRLDLAPEYDAEVRRLDQLTEALFGEPFNLIAHDYGGYIGLGFVLRRPQRVRRLAILNSRAHRTFSPSFYRQTAVQCFLARNEITRPFLERLPIGLLHRILMRRYVKLGCFPSEILRRYVGWMDEPDGRTWYAHFYAHYQLRERSGLADGLRHIACPTAVIWGDRDPYCPFATGEELAERIPAAVLTRVAGADHFVMEERPDEVGQALRALLSRAN